MARGSIPCLPTRRAHCHGGGARDGAAGKSGTANLSLTLRPIARCSANLMWWAIRRGPPADETRLRGHKPQMFAIAFTYRLADDGNRPFGRVRPCPGWAHVRSPPDLESAPRRAYRRAGSAWLRRRSRLVCGISLRELVFEGQDTMRPGGKSIRLFELLKLREQLAAEACPTHQAIDLPAWLGRHGPVSPSSAEAGQWPARARGGAVGRLGLG